LHFCVVPQWINQTGAAARSGIQAAGPTNRAAGEEFQRQRELEFQ
jgi:hypothetical protein